MPSATRTGGRPATGGVIAGGVALSVGDPGTSLPAGFAWTRLTDVARLESGHTPSRRHPEYWDGEIPWIGIKDATANHGRRIRGTNQWVTQAGIDNSSARVLPADTVCLSRTASVGYVLEMGVPMATSQDFVNWVCGPELDHRYLKYVLLAEHDHLHRFASGTTHQTIYFPEVKAFHVALPPLEYQRAVADVLNALDDKIETNERISRLLQAEMRAELEALHGGAAQEIGAVASLVRESVQPGSLPDDTAYIGLEHMPQRDLALGNRGSARDVTSTKSRFRKGDVLFGKLRPYFNKVAAAHFDGICSSDILVVRPTDEEWRPWLALTLSSSPVIDHATAVSSGTRMPRAKWADLASYEAPVPSADLHREWSRSANVKFDLIASLCRENSSLAATRDLLLPRLLSGELRVSSAERRRQEMAT